jgi:hypothetical protein
MLITGDPVGGMRNRTLVALVSFASLGSVGCAPRYVGSRAAAAHRVEQIEECLEDQHPASLIECLKGIDAFEGSVDDPNESCWAQVLFRTEAVRIDVALGGLVVSGGPEGTPQLRFSARTLQEDGVAPVLRALADGPFSRGCLVASVMATASRRYTSIPTAVAPDPATQADLEEAMRLGRTKGALVGSQIATRRRERADTLKEQFGPIVRDCRLRGVLTDSRCASLAGLSPGERSTCSERCRAAGLETILAAARNDCALRWASTSGWCERVDERRTFEVGRCHAACEESGRRARERAFEMALQGCVRGNDGKGLGPVACMVASPGSAYEPANLAEDLKQCSTACKPLREEYIRDLEAERAATARADAERARAEAERRAQEAREREAAARERDRVRTAADAAAAAAKAAADAAAQKKAQERAACMSKCTGQGRDPAVCGRICK